jgi:hypothetical protein
MEKHMSTTYVLKYVTLLTFFIYLTIFLFYKYVCKSINIHVKYKVRYSTIDIKIHILL